MPHLGPTELLLILLIVIAIFGAGKLANLGGALGKGVRDFRAAMKSDEGESEEGEAESKPAAQSKSEAEKGDENKA
ncbi:MAG: twin-arginine translocase TatA/TatE family subunit [Chloroflexi bacterium]|nr:twin-arginine translocase TatA/TatE family subunit [Chloroflexota bacterium]